MRQAITVGILVLAAALARGGRLASAVTIGTFVDVPNIPGEATFPPVAGQIQAISFTWGVTQAKATRYGTAGVCSAGRSKPVFDGLCVLKHVDKASPKLFLAAAQGTVLQTVTISTWDTDLAAATQPLSKYELSNAIVSSIQQGAGQAGDPIPTEKVCLNFSKAKMTVSQTNTDGTIIDTVTAGFDACGKSAF